MKLDLVAFYDNVCLMPEICYIFALLMRYWGNRVKGFQPNIYAFENK